MGNLIELDQKHFIHPTSSIKQQQKYGPKAIMEHGEGIYLTDIHGKKYMDGMSSLWNVNIGHGRKELVDAAAEQMKKLAFSSTFSTFSNIPAIKLAEKIAQISPENLNAVFLTSGGSESNDTAFKLARHYWKIKGMSERKKIISLKRGYHGVAAGATSATGISAFWKMAGHLMTDFHHVKSPYQESTKEAILSLEKMIKEEGPDTIAAFIAEPVQGAGGVLIPPQDYFFEIRKLCDKYNILFIADEVITGFGRTGKMFGLEHWGVLPDMMTFAKGVSSGYVPLGGVVISDHIHEILKEKSEGVLFHGFTYSGHPTAAAVGLKNIEIIEQESLVEHARQMGEKLYYGFLNIKQNMKIVGNVRTLGLLGAVEIVKNPVTHERFSKEVGATAKVIEALHDRGVICRGVTYDGTDIICFAPPLVINEKQLNDMLEKLQDALSFVQNKLHYT